MHFYFYAETHSRVMETFLCYDLLKITGVMRKNGCKTTDYVGLMIRGITYTEHRLLYRGRSSEKSASNSDRPSQSNFLVTAGSSFQPSMPHVWDSRHPVAWKVKHDYH